MLYGRTRTPIRIVAAVACATILSSAMPYPVHAASAEPHAEKAELGHVFLRRHDYAAASGAFGQALALATEAKASRPVLSALKYNVALSQYRAFASFDGQRWRLQLALQMLDEEVVADESEAANLRSGVEAALERMIALEIAARPDGPRGGMGPARPGRKKIVGGLVFIGAGIASLQVALGGVLLANNAEEEFKSNPEGRDDADRTGRAANGMIIGGAIGTALWTVIGAAMVSQGRALDRVAELRRTASIQPWVGLAGVRSDGNAVAGAGLGGRF